MRFDGKERAMTRAPVAPPLGPEYDRFLFASIDEAPEGKLLSVVSALARTGVDPWREAAHLASMPRETAAARLTALISELADEPDARVSADRLIALLPGAKDIPPPVREGAAVSATSDGPRLGLGFGAIAFLIAIAFLCWIHQSPRPAPIDGDPLPTGKISARLLPMEPKR